MGKQETRVAKEEQETRCMNGKTGNKGSKRRTRNKVLEWENRKQGQRKNKKQGA